MKPSGDVPGVSGEWSVPQSGLVFPCFSNHLATAVVYLRWPFSVLGKGWLLAMACCAKVTNPALPLTRGVVDTFVLTSVLPVFERGVNGGVVNALGLGAVGLGR
jgi:hypothetical protein